MAKRNDEPVKVDASVLRQAKFVAFRRGITVAEYVSEILRPVVAADYKVSVEEQAREAGVLPPAEPPKPAPKKGGK